MDFTGERFIPDHGTTSMQEDHIARYEFALQFSTGIRVLDIACGSGYGSFILSKNAQFVDGIDISIESIHFAQSQYKKDNINFQVGDINNYYSDKKYDLIVCFETLEHIENYKTVLKNLKSLLAPNGKLIISSPNRLITSPKCKDLNDRPGKYHIREFTILELKEIIKKIGFHIQTDLVYGQRIQKYFSYSIMRWIYNTLMKPKKRSNYKVLPIPNNKEPRYFIIVATN